MTASRLAILAFLHCCGGALAAELAPKVGDFRAGDVIHDADGREVGTILDAFTDSGDNLLVRVLPADYPKLRQKEFLIAAEALKKTGRGGYEALLTPEEIVQLPEARAGAAR